MSDRFLGNHTHTDYFKLLRQDGDSLVIGARNVIYNISIEGLVENREQVRRRQIQTLRKKKKKCEEGNERLGKANARARLRASVAASSYRVHFVDGDLAARHARLDGIGAAEFRELVPKSGADLS